MINASKIATLYMLSCDDTVNGSIIFSIGTPSKPIDHGKLVSTYQYCLKKHPQLRSKLEISGNEYLFSAPQYDSNAVNTECDRIVEQASLQDIINEPAQLKNTFPFRIRITNDGQIVFACHHALMNGRSAFYWTERFLDYYTNFDNTNFDNTNINLQSEGDIQLQSKSLYPTPNNRYRTLLGHLQVIGYLIHFFGTYYFRKSKTVDFSNRKTPASLPDYTLKTLCLSYGDTKNLIANTSEREGLLKEVCRMAAETAFHVQPDNNRVNISIPNDMSAHYEDIDTSSAGNFTGALILQCFRDANLSKQINKQYKQFKRKLPYHIANFLAALSKDETSILRNMKQQSRKTIHDRGPLEDYSLAISNPGKVPGTSISNSMSDYWITTKIQTPIIVLSTFKEKMSITFSYDRNLYNEAQTNLFWEQFSRSIVDMARLPKVD